MVVFRDELIHEKLIVDVCVAAAARSGMLKGTVGVVTIAWLLIQYLDG